MAYFGPGEILWIADNSALLELRTNELQFEIKIPENNIEIVTSFPNQARAVIGTLMLYDRCDHLCDHMCCMLNNVSCF